MYVKILHIFCLPLIRDGFLILIILSRKSRPVPETSLPFVGLLLIYVGL